MSAEMAVPAKFGLTDDFVGEKTQCQKERQAMQLPDSSTAVIIGAGFGGICAAIHLAQSGQRNFVVLERSSGPGGVWHRNRYPGAACDVPSSLYSYSFVRDYDWSGTHGSWAEIVEYLEHCIARYDIADRFIYDVDVAQATWEDQQRGWIVSTSRGTIRSTYLVSACGLFNKPAIPQLPGISSFPGPVFHSADWDAKFDPAGKKVGVVGTGCSAAQFVPELVERASQVRVFQRSPCHVMPKEERTFSPEERSLFRSFPILRALERAALENGTDAFVAFQFDDSVREAMNEQILAGMSGAISDPVKRSQLLPGFHVGGKRPISSATFLQALDRENVSIISEGIERIEPKGVVTSDGKVHDVDAIIFGTGFLASDYLTPLNIRGVDGHDLNEAWKDGAYAYLGMLIDGFPNFCMIYGPNSNAVGSILQMIEPQAKFIVSQIALAERTGKIIAVSHERVRKFNVQLQDALAASVYGKNLSTNYFRGPSGKVVTQWPGTPSQFEAAIAALEPASLLCPSSPQPSDSRQVPANAN